MTTIRDIGSGRLKGIEGLIMGERTSDGRKQYIGILDNGKLKVK